MLDEPNITDAANSDKSAKDSSMGYGHLGETRHDGTLDHGNNSDIVRCKVTVLTGANDLKSMALPPKSESS